MDALPATAPALVAVGAAQDAGAREASAHLVRTRLRLALPNTVVETVTPSALPGFYAVRLAGGRLAYTDATARYLVLGVAFDLHTGHALDDALDAQTVSR